MKKFSGILIVLFMIATRLSGQDSLFIRTYGMNGYNYGEKLIQDADSGFIILGNKSGFIGNTDAYLVKTDKYGALVWDEAYGSSEVNWAKDFVKTTDKGFIIAGYMTVPEKNNDYDIMLLKTDSAGNFKWMKHIGGSDWDFAYSIVETADSGFLMTGETYSIGNGNNDVFILKTNKDGDSLWMKSYGGPEVDIAYDISTCHDGNFFITGTTNSFGHGMFDFYLLKINGNGDTLWSQTYGDTLNDKAFAGIETSDHGIAMTGSTSNYNAQGQDGTTFKADSTGVLIWTRIYGGPYDEEFYDIIEKSNKSLFIAGYTMSSGYIGTKEFTMTLTNPDGWFTTGTNFGGMKEDVAYACINTYTNGFAAVGSTSSMGQGLSNILLIKTDSTVISDIVNTYHHYTDIPENTQPECNVFPNPFHDELMLNLGSLENVSEVNLYNTNGEKIFHIQEPMHKLLHINTSMIPAGLYFIEVVSEKNILRKKIIHY